MRKARVILSFKRDLPLLLFLWRWKVATTRALHARFFRDCSLLRAYTRLWQFASAGYIVSVHVERAQGTAWSLTKRGFLVIRDQLPVLQEDGFKSENAYHDLVCASFQLGDWIDGQPRDTSLFPEQQIRRYALESYDAWVPKTTAHRPDGYTLIKGPDGERVFAIEVEINRKSISAYQSLGSFYTYHRNIHRVMWLVNRTSYAEHLQSHLATYDSQAASIHNFTTMDQFLKLGWSSPIAVGPERGRTIRDLYDAHLGRRKAEESGKTSSALLFLDARKSYVRRPLAPRPITPPRLLAPIRSPTEQTPPNVSTIRRPDL